MCSPSALFTHRTKNEVNIIGNMNVFNIFL